MPNAFLAGRHIAVGVGGGIAAYKVCDFVRELRRQGADVRVAMTQAAQQFITPLSLQSLSGHPVLTDYFDTSQEEQFGHLHLSRWADAFVIAPATADLTARIHAGLANDAVTTSLLAFRGPVLLAPAMNTAMWEHELTQRNINEIKRVGRFSVVGPGVGPLADGDVGAGRLAELAELVSATSRLFESGPLAGKRVLLTAGPTREAIDPVRFLSNPSTGRMGLELAATARSLGAEVTVVLGPTQLPAPEGVRVVSVTTAEQMLEACEAHIEGVDFFVATAAVSDWKAQSPSPRKTKKGDGPESLVLVRTPDVLATISQRVHQSSRRPVLVGFAAETHDLETYAQQKLERKRLDFIVANDVSEPGSGFGSESNSVIVFDRHRARYTHAGSKRDVARWLWALLAR